MRALRSFWTGRRYLGAERGDAFIAANPGTDDIIIIRMTPEHWHSADFGKTGS